MALPGMIVDTGDGQRFSFAEYPNLQTMQMTFPDVAFDSIVHLYNAHQAMSARSWEQARSLLEAAFDVHRRNNTPRQHGVTGMLPFEMILRQLLSISCFELRCYDEAIRHSSPVIEAVHPLQNFPAYFEAVRLQIDSYRAKSQPQRALELVHQLISCCGMNPDLWQLQQQIQDEIREKERRETQQNLGLRAANTQGSRTQGYQTSGRREPRSRVPSLDTSTAEATRSQESLQTASQEQVSVSSSPCLSEASPSGSQETIPPKSRPKMRVSQDSGPSCHTPGLPNLHCTVKQPPAAGEQNLKLPALPRSPSENIRSQQKAGRDSSGETKENEAEVVAKDKNRPMMINEQENISTQFDGKRKETCVNPGQFLIPQEAMHYVKRGNMAFAMGYSGQAASLYKEALSIFGRYNGTSNFTTHFERDLLTAITKCQYDTGDYGDVVRYATEALRGEVRDEYALECLYYREQAHEVTGDFKNAYRDVIELLRFYPTDWDLLARRNKLKQIVMFHYLSSQGATQIQPAVAEARRRSASRRSTATLQTTETADTKKCTENTDDKVEPKLSLNPRPPPRMKKVQPKKTRKKNRKRTKAKGSATKPVTQEQTEVPCSLQQTSAIQLEDASDSSDIVSDHEQQASNSSASTNTLASREPIKGTNKDSVPQAIKTETSGMRTQVEREVVQTLVKEKHASPKKPEVEPRGLHGSKPKRSSKQIAELQQKREEMIQEKVELHETLAAKEMAEREQNKKKMQQLKVGKGEKSCAEEAFPEEKIVKFSEVVVPRHDKMYEGIPGKAELKHRRRKQKGQRKPPRVVTIPAAVYSGNSWRIKTQLCNQTPVIMTGGEQLVLSEASVSSSTTEKAESTVEVKNTKRRWEVLEPLLMLKETASHIMHTVLRTGTEGRTCSAFHSGFDFSQAVVSRGKEVCARCFIDQKHSKIVAKDPVSRTCPVHRDTAWRPLLIWPEIGGDAVSRFVPIRVRPRNVNVHFVVCRFKSRCYLAENCPYPHSEEELQAWTLDRDGKNWQYRQPNKLVLCENFQLWSRCPSVHRCPYAHGEKELAEWRRRRNLYRKRLDLQDENRGTAFSFRRRLAEELQAARENRSKVQDLIAFQCPGVTVSCDPSEMVYITSRTSGSYKQLFQLRLSFLSDSNSSLQRAVLVDASGYFSFSPSLDYQMTRDNSEIFANSKSRQSNSQLVELEFNSPNERSFRQDVVFDLGSKPYLVKTLRIEIGSSEELVLIKELQKSMKGDSDQWTFDPYDLCQDYIDYSRRDTESTQYPLPQEQELMPLIHKVLDQTLSSRNYHSRFHTLLYVEEVARVAALRRFNRRGLDMEVRKRPEGTLGEIDLGYRPPPNSATSALIRLRDSTVFELKIWATLGEKISLLLPPQFLIDEEIIADSVVTVDFQLAFDRTYFILSHQAVNCVRDQSVTDRLIATSRDRKAWKITESHYSVPVNSRLNTEQRTAVERIFGQRGTLPVIVNGPFGTGKTHLLAEAVCLILGRRSACRVLICTQSNHAADLYVTKIDDFLQRAQASVSLHRVYHRNYNISRISDSLYPVISRYFTYKDNQFVMPNKKTLLDSDHLVVITTLATSMHLRKLDLPESFFTHIVIDEAAQATEPETVAALSLASVKTLVVMAGDHKQVNPPVYSPVARMGKLHYSLFRRLYKEMSNVLGLKVDLVANYRCHYDILNISSRLFYGTDNVDRSNALGPQDTHPKFKPVSFYATSDTKSTQAGEDGSYYNAKEAQAVVRQVERILADWPWWPYEDNDLCVITTEKWQARYIRSLLRTCSEKVEVLTSTVVQGRQFRACVISTVLTEDGYRERNNTYDTDFVSNAKLLNTAITRAQSLVLVIGDPACLCTCGRLSQLWLQYIVYCKDNDGYHGALQFETFMLRLGIVRAELNPQSAAFVPGSSTASRRLRHVKVEIEERKVAGEKTVWGQTAVDGADSDDDMVEEYRRQVARKKIERDRLQFSSKATVKPVESGRGYEWRVVDHSTIDDRVNHDGLVQYEKYLRGDARFEALRQNPMEFFRCRLNVVNDDEAIAVVQSKSAMKITIGGWKRRNRSFDGEEVLVRLDEPLVDGYQDTKPVYGTVVGIFQEERPSEWVCIPSKREKNLLLPLDKSFPPIINLPRKVEDDGVVIFDRVSRNDRHHSIEPISFVPAKEASSKLFIVQFLKWRIDCRRPLGIVVEVREVGATFAPGMELLSRQYLPRGVVNDVLSQEAEESAASLPEQISQSEYLSRGRAVLNAFTVDSLHTSDLDDALSFVSDVNSGECRVGVYIADVSHFIEPGSTLDSYAFIMGTTYYDKDGRRRHNMLPERLSSDLCSLKPGVDRLAVCIMFTFDGDSKLIKKDIKRCIVRSSRKLSYEVVETIIDGDMSSMANSALANDIKGLYKLSVQLRRKRLLGTKWHLRHNHTSECPRSHAMVEEFMLLANKTVAESLIDNCRFVAPLIAQGSADRAKIDEWINTFSPYIDASCALSEIAQNASLRSLPQRNLQTAVGPITVSKDQWRPIQLALQTSKGSSLRQKLLLFLCTESLFPQLAMAHTGYHRSLQRALYVCADHLEDAVLGHCQLGFKYYTHFTSPIRRYVDVVAHRLLIAHVIDSENANRDLYTEEKVKEICCHCSRTRVLADRFQRESELFSVSCEAYSNPLLTAAAVRSASSGLIQLYFPDCSNLSGKPAEIRVSALNPIESTVADDGTLTVTWSVRVLRHPLAVKRRVVSSNLPHERYYSIPVDDWKQLMSSVLSESSTTEDILHCVRNVEDSAEIPRILPDVVDGSLEMSEDDGDDDLAEADFKAPLEICGHGLAETVVSMSDEDITGMAENSSSFVAVDDTLDGKLQTLTFSDVSSDNEDFQSLSGTRKVLRKRKDLQAVGSKCEVVDAQHIDPSTLVSLKCRTGSLLSVQLSSRLSRGLLRPYVQLLRLPGKAEITFCVEHYNKPVECFVESLPYCHRASKDSYSDLEDYASAWLPVVDSESATSSVKDSPETVLVTNTAVQWTNSEQSSRLLGHIELTLSFIRANNLDCYEGDFVCLRYVDVVVDKNEQVTKEQEPSETKCSPGLAHVNGTYQWVSHCRIVKRTVEEGRSEGDPKRVHLDVETTGERQCVPDFLLSKTRIPVHCTAQFTSQKLPFLRMIRTLKKMVEHSRAARSLCMGVFDSVLFGSRYAGDCSDEVRKGLSVPALLSHPNRPLNENQFIAVKLAMKQDITLIQGPPGTGKTVTGAHIVFQFLEQRNCIEPLEGEERRQVMYCCPSNQTVDDVTERLKTALGSKRILRLYGEGIEKKRFPGLSIFKEFAAPRTKQMTVDSKNHRDVALHYRIRQQNVSQFWEGIKRMEQLFRRMKERGQVPNEDQVDEYEKLVSRAEQEQIRKADVILCTCIQAGSRRVTSNPMALCIVDEAGQSMEPETLVAISKAERVVLIGDHKQLRPVVQNSKIRSQLSRSMFERIAESLSVKKEGRVHMLTVQYRMHEDICHFPSQHFYSGNLQTAVEVKTRPSKGLDFWNHVFSAHSSSHIGTQKHRCFVHVEGEEHVNPVATTAGGGEESKYNLNEARLVVHIVKTMIKYRCSSSAIRVLTPYTAQKAHLDGLFSQSQQTANIQVSSVFASQGSEADFIVLSTVRSLPKRDLMDTPSRKWMRDHFGFISDEHQMNVALTRAKHGLVIVGNSNLLALHSMWRNLLAHYKQDGCFIENWID